MSIVLQTSLFTRTPCGLKLKTCPTPGVGSRKSICVPEVLKLFVVYVASSVLSIGAEAKCHEVKNFWIDVQDRIGMQAAIMQKKEKAFQVRSCKGKRMQRKGKAFPGRESNLVKDIKKALQLLWMQPNPQCKQTHSKLLAIWRYFAEKVKRTSILLATRGDAQIIFATHEPSDPPPSVSIELNITLGSENFSIILPLIRRILCPLTQALSFGCGQGCMHSLLFSCIGCARSIVSIFVSCYPQ